MAFTDEEIQDAIQEAITKGLADAKLAHDREMADMRLAHQTEMDALRVSLSGVQPSPVPMHSGGPGTQILQTWSLYDQQLAVLGEHPMQLVKTA